MTERTARLDHLLREEISAIIAREIADPRVGFVTVTEVDVTPDLGHATVWVSAIGSPDERRASIRALGRAMPFVRHRLGSLRLKRIPQLHLREDDSASRGTRVMHILRELGEGTLEPGEEGLGSLPTPRPARSSAPPILGGTAAGGGTAVDGGTAADGHREARGAGASSGRHGSRRGTAKSERGTPGAPRSPGGRK